MSVRGLVTVVIGVGLRKAHGAPLEQFRGNQTSLSQGSLNRSLRQGNPELAEADSFGQVQRLYTRHPNGMKRKSMLAGNCKTNMRSFRGEIAKDRHVTQLTSVKPYSEYDVRGAIPREIGDKSLDPVETMNPCHKGSDSVSSDNLNLQHYNTLGTRKSKGIVQSLSNKWSKLRIDSLITNIEDRCPQWVTAG